MFLKFFLWTVLLSASIWYFHENHPVTFMKIFRNIPYLSPLMASLHSKGISSSKTSTETKEQFLLPDELSRYNGEDGSLGMYIAILGRVYDVKKGSKHYGKGSAYHVFTGKDASRSFITGEFSDEQASDEVIDLSHSELLSLKDWVNFYDDHYEYIGKVIGKYYTSTGEKTDYHHKLDSLIEEANVMKTNAQQEKQKFPPCNTEWSQGKGHRLWCSPKSGGISRSWTGVPRKLYEVGSNKHQCVCVNLDHLEDPASPIYAQRGRLREYEGCLPSSQQCVFKDKIP